MKKTNKNKSRKLLLFFIGFLVLSNINISQVKALGPDCTVKDFKTFLTYYPQDEFFLSNIILSEYDPVTDMTKAGAYNSYKQGVSNAEDLLEKNANCAYDKLMFFQKRYNISLDNIVSDIDSISAFQKVCGIPVDGMIGPTTAKTFNNGCDNKFECIEDSQCKEDQEEKCIEFKCVGKKSEGEECNDTSECKKDLVCREDENSTAFFPGNSDVMKASLFDSNLDLDTGSKGGSLFIFSAFLFVFSGFLAIYVLYEHGNLPIQHPEKFRKKKLKKSIKRKNEKNK